MGAGLAELSFPALSPPDGGQDCAWVSLRMCELIFLPAGAGGGGVCSRSGGAGGLRGEVTGVSQVAPDR